MLLCSLFDLLWEVLGAEKVLRRDVEEEEGPAACLKGERAFRGVEGERKVQFGCGSVRAWFF